MEEIIRYYEQTWHDYSAMWFDRKSRALHFGYYDETVVTHAQALLNANRILASFAAVGPGDRVLDAGCGIGGSTCWLAEHRSAEAIGITPVMRQVRKARELAAGRGLSKRTQFICADYLNTPFAEASFDVVWALESLCHAADKAAFYREASRLLRPGGRLVVAEYMRLKRPCAAAEEALLREWFSGWSMPDLATRHEHEQAASAAGLNSISVVDMTPAVAKSLRRLHLLARATGGADRLLHALRIRSREQHRNVVASRVQYEAQRRGLWFYGVLCAQRE